MTFNEANDLPSYEIVRGFGIVEKNDICFDCTRYEKCRARLVFRVDNPNSAIAKCHQFALLEMEDD